MRNKASTLRGYGPQRAKKSARTPSGTAWLHELKYEGERAALIVEAGEARLEGADGRDLTPVYPGLVRAAATLAVERVLLDGLVAWLLPDGRTQHPRRGAKAARARLVYLAFDMLRRDRCVWSKRPLEARKRALRELLAGQTELRYVEHFDAPWQTVVEHVCRLGLPGLISKRRDRPHLPGPSVDWRESACAGGADRFAGIAISTPERPVYPALGFTKLDLARFYAQVADWVLPHVAHRPLTLVRCERGVSRADALRSECRFLRHQAGYHRWADASVSRLHIQEQKKVGEYLTVDSARALLSLIQGDIVELHCWNARAPAVELPDRVVFDLDPGPDVPWREVLRAARMMRTHLQRIGLACWPMLTGGEGLHVVVPLEPELTWSVVYAFTRQVAEAVRASGPALFTTNFSRAGRAKQILIDYKRNSRGAVAVAAYSTRANPRGTVSVPVRWDELSPALRSDHFTVHNLPQRLARLREDPWRDYWRCRQRIAR